MDGILNKIINLDNQAKNKIIQIKQKEENIETYISETIEKEKKEIDSRFLYKRKITQEKYDKMFEESKKKLDEEKDKQIDLMAEYIESKKILVDKYCYALTKERIKQYFENKAKELLNK